MKTDESERVENPASDPDSGELLADAQWWVPAAVVCGGALGALIGGGIFGPFIGPLIGAIAGPILWALARRRA